MTSTTSTYWQKRMTGEYDVYEEERKIREAIYLLLKNKLTDKE